jgi:two-component system, NarL family, nitrate/nitrite response regulator NarL
MATSGLSASSIGRHPAVRTQPLSLLISDDTAMGCQLLRDVLIRSRLNAKVVTCAVSREQIIDAMKSQHVDIALVSENLEDGPLAGFRVLNDLRTSHPKTRVVILLNSLRDELVVDAFRGGAKGVFCRSETWQRLCKCIKSVHQGQIWANSHHFHCILDALINATPLRLVNLQGRRLLTKREDDVVKLVADGLSNRNVAHKLGLTEHTVSNYLFRIYEKLGISSRVELVLYALKQRQG